MNPDVFQKTVWEVMLYAQMRGNYFAELVRRYQLWDKGLRALTLVATSGVVVTVFSQANAELRLGVPIAATALSFWLLLSQYTSMARDASELHAGWSSVARDYEGVWNSLAAADAQERYQQIYGRAGSLSRIGAKFPNRKDRLNYWLDQATTLSMAQYAH